MKVLIIDNNDSFSYNLKHYIEHHSAAVTVIRGDRLELDYIHEFNKVILSPGPGLPSEHPVLLQVLDRFVGKKSILGICLGHQAIAEYFGANLSNLEQVKHGLSSSLTHFSNCILYNNLPSSFNVGHYHSWVVSKNSIPKDLIVTSENEDGLIMSFRHASYDIKAVQFHPESILTENGLNLIANWLNH